MKEVSLVAVCFCILTLTNSALAQVFFDEPIADGRLISDSALAQLYDDSDVLNGIDFEEQLDESLFDSIFGPVLEVGEFICQPVITFGKGAINYTVITICTLPPVGPVLLLTGTDRPTSVFND